MTFLSVRMFWASCVLAATGFACSSTPNVVDGTQKDATIEPEAGGETADAGGSDAGGSIDSGPSDAGIADAGPCSSPADCHGRGASVPMCSASSSFSCVNGACLWECMTPGRACKLGDDGSGACLRCPAAPALNSCPFINCRSLPAMRVSASTCTTFPLTNDVISLKQVGTGAASCKYEASRLAGPDSLGYITRIDTTDLVADVPGQGGACTGKTLGSGIAIHVFSCPRCQFQLEVE